MPSQAAGLVVFLASQGAAGANVRSYEGYTFEQYLAEFGKSYGAEELQQRRATFETSLRTILEHNQEFASGRKSWYMAVNHLADLSEPELKQLRSAKYDPRSSAPVLQLPRAANPESMDWREHGAVTPVKNQGGCGSCWAFAATETVESHLQIATGQLLQLAPQTYVNCVKNPQECGGTGGCEGATMELAFNLTRDRGIALESDLPYAGRDQQCGEYKAAAVAAGYVKNPTNEAAGLETALATKGPVSVTVAAEPWTFYGGGIFTGCSGSASGAVLDHGVQAVGYSQDYWLVRNSWGPGWGEQGYIRISRASDGQSFTNKRPADGVACKPYPETQTVGGECGILFDTSYPTGVALAPSQVVV